MTDTNTLRDELKRRVDAIEGGYELMLAYAAQGLPKDHSSQTGGQLREALERFDDSTHRTRRAVSATRRRRATHHVSTYDAFLEVLARDAEAAQAAIRVVTAQSGISSLLVDNLNASVHVRTLLTDVFVIDEALK